jgi:hypothetical protein
MRQGPRPVRPLVADDFLWLSRQSRRRTSGTRWRLGQDRPVWSLQPAREPGPDN